jgi:uncharacterized protein YegP (UPF0339 family)
METVEVWRQADGFWRWRYRDTDEGTALLSADIYETRQDAESGGRLAYPGVPMVEAPPVRTRSGRLARRIRRVAILGLALALPLWAARTWRRLRARLSPPRTNPRGRRRR